MAHWKSLFSPAIRLLNRLGYTQKFTLVWLVSFGALAFLVYSLYLSVSQVIQPGLRQLDGLALVKPVAAYVRLLQQHRGIMVAFSGELDKVQTLRQRNQREVQQAFDEMRQKMPDTLRSSPEFTELEHRWEYLYRYSEQLTVPENLVLHNELIEKVHLFAIRIADVYGLRQDSETATFYLIDVLFDELPYTLDTLGQLRALATRALAGQTAGSQQVRLGALVAQVRYGLAEVHDNLDKVARYSPTTADQVRQVEHQLSIDINKVLELTNTDVMTGYLVTPPQEYFELATLAIDTGYRQFDAVLLPLAEQLIQERIRQARVMLLLSVLIAGSLFLFLVYFSVSMYYAIIDSIRQLARAARDFARGDLSVRVHLQTEDELRQIGDSFNHMADSFQDMLAAREEDDARVHAAIEKAMDGVLLMDSDGRVVGWNEQAESIFGWTRQEVMGRLLHEMIIPLRYHQAHFDGVQRFLRERALALPNARVELVALHRDGHEFPVEITMTPIKMTRGFEFCAFVRDITDRKKSDELIWRQANLDALTGLPNRHMFYDRLAQEIKQVNRYGQELALFFIDLDKFKEVNDTLGHGMGDELLLEAAGRLKSSVRETDTVARLGGDEFVVILREIDTPTSIERVAQAILNQLSRVFYLQQQPIYISASIGITLYPVDATDIEQLLKNADQAMYAAKARGRNCFSYFTASMQQAVLLRQRLVNDLRLALADQQFELYYQPVVEVLTGRVHKAEALIRWHHPEFGLVNPDRFIPLTEETGMIVEIGDWIMQQAGKQLYAWQQTYDASFEMSVNISPVQFQHANTTCAKWVENLRQLGLKPQNMVFEITENLLLEMESTVKQRLAELREAGVRIAIDDFGTGYSSLAYLKKFDIDYLKIDRAFVQNLVTDSGNMALCEAIIVMAHKLGLRVIAEGVETVGQRDLLDMAGCDFLQGYLYAKPLPAQEFEKLFKPSEQSKG